MKTKQFFDIATHRKKTNLDLSDSNEIQNSKKTREKKGKKGKKMYAK